MPIHRITDDLVKEILDSYGPVRKLNLSSNSITKVEGLEALSLCKLNLSANRLSSEGDSLNGLSLLTSLEDLNLSGNAIVDLTIFGTAPTGHLLERLNLGDNYIDDFSQLKHLAALPVLTSLLLVGNPLAGDPSYRAKVAALLPNLKELDCTPLERTPYPLLSAVFEESSDYVDGGKRDVDVGAQVASSESGASQLPIAESQVNVLESGHREDLLDYRTEEDDDQHGMDSLDRSSDALDVEHQEPPAEVYQPSDNGAAVVPSLTPLRVDMPAAASGFSLPTDAVQGDMQIPPAAPPTAVVSPSPMSVNSSNTVVTSGIPAVSTVESVSARESATSPVGVRSVEPNPLLASAYSQSGEAGLGAGVSGVGIAVQRYTEESLRSDSVEKVAFAGDRIQLGLDRQQQVGWFTTSGEQSTVVSESVLVTGAGDQTKLRDAYEREHSPSDGAAAAPQQRRRSAAQVRLEKEVEHQQDSFRDNSPQRYEQEQRHRNIPPAREHNISSKKGEGSRVHLEPSLPTPPIPTVAANVELSRENDRLRNEVVLLTRQCDAMKAAAEMTERTLAAAHSERRRGTRLVRRRPWEKDQYSQNQPASSDVEYGDGEQEKYVGVDNRRKEGGEEEQGDKDGFYKLLNCWRKEVLRLMVQGASDKIVSAQTAATTASTLEKERKAQLAAENKLSVLSAKQTAAQAEVELLSSRLATVTEEANTTKQKCRKLEAENRAHAAAEVAVKETVSAFSSMAAADNYMGKGAEVAESLARLEGFSTRLTQAAGHLKVIELLQRRREVQLRNEKAALAADRRVWSLERERRELAAIALTPSNNITHNKPNTKLTTAGGASQQRTINKSTSSNLSAVGDVVRGLRSECEAVMRAIFCKLDSSDSGCVDAALLVQVLRDDSGVSRLMTQAVGEACWAEALNILEAKLCNVDGEETKKGGADVTWGEFLLCFIPSPRTSANTERPSPLQAFLYNSTRTNKNANIMSSSKSSRGGGSNMRGTDISALSLAPLQMVLPDGWGGEGGPHDDYELRLETLSVRQLRGEVQRLAKERAFLMEKISEDGSQWSARVEAAYDQFRHEIQYLSEEVRRLEDEVDKAQTASVRARSEAGELKKQLNIMQAQATEAEDAWQRRLKQALADGDARATAASSSAAVSASLTAERQTRLEAELTVLRREQGKAAVAQRALERTLSRAKESAEMAAAQAKVELAAKEQELAGVKRERNSLLAAIREHRTKSNAALASVVSSLPARRGDTPLQDKSNNVEVASTTHSTSISSGESNHQAGRPSPVNGASGDAKMKASDWSGPANNVNASVDTSSLAKRLERVTLRTHSLLLSDSEDEESDTGAEENKGGLQ